MAKHSNSYFLNLSKTKQQGKQHISTFVFLQKAKLVTLPSEVFCAFIKLLTGDTNCLLPTPCDLETTQSMYISQKFWAKSLKTSLCLGLDDSFKNIMNSQSAITVLATLSFFISTSLCEEISQHWWSISPRLAGASFWYSRVLQTKLSIRRQPSWHHLLLRIDSMLQRGIWKQERQMWLCSFSTRPFLKWISSIFTTVRLYSTSGQRHSVLGPALPCLILLALSVLWQHWSPGQLRWIWKVKWWTESSNGFSFPIECMW